MNNKSKPTPDCVDCLKQHRSISRHGTDHKQATRLMSRPNFIRRDTGESTARRQRKMFDHIEKNCSLIEGTHFIAPADLLLSSIHKKFS